MSILQQKIKQQIQQMDSRLSHSSLEKNFQTQSTFKRNSRYYNVPEMINNQNQESILRRKPISFNQQNLEKKVDNSFTNSTTALSYRLKKQMNKFSRRVSGQFSPPKSDYQREYSSPSSPKLKSFSIQKMQSRDELHRLKNKQVEDERQFNNFKIQDHDLSKTCDFSKLKGKSLDFKLKHINDIYHETKKPYDFCFYKQTTMKSKVNYKVENKQKQRYFFIKKRASDFPATVLNPQKVDIGLKIASNFRTSNLDHTKIPPFYLTPGKQLPSQYDMRYMTHLTNFYRNNDDKLIEPKVDFIVKKFKQDMIARRKESLQEKRTQFNRDEICDMKYFKQQLYKNSKAKGHSKNTKSGVFA